MFSDTRNELLELLEMELCQNEKDRKFKLELLLERFEDGIQRKIEEANRVIEKEKENLEVLEIVKQKLNIDK